MTTGSALGTRSYDEHDANALQQGDFLYPPSFHSSKFRLFHSFLTSLSYYVSFLLFLFHLNHSFVFSFPLFSFSGWDCSWLFCWLCLLFLCCVYAGVGGSCCGLPADTSKQGPAVVAYCLLLMWRPLCAPSLRAVFLAMLGAVSKRSPYLPPSCSECHFCN